MSYFSENTPQPARKPSALTVSELNRQVKRMLEVSYAQVWVVGELSGLAKPSSGHWYFSLKDSKAQIRCAMFRGFNQRLRYQPKEGDKVIVRGKLSLYEGRGDYQLIAEGMEPAGIGELQAAFEALKLKLSAEGLFDQCHKKPVPTMPRSVCIITSPTGAVIHDILHVSRRRFPAMEINLIPVAVQGEGAAQQIAHAIRLANRHKPADLIIVGRGGGSLEDLWAFNEELVARAIHQSDLPIISAVGHEVDFSIADMVADLRAPTPSAAAEYITPDQFELSQKLDDQQRRLTFLFRNTIDRAQNKLQALQKRVQHPGKALEIKAQRAESLSKALEQLIQLGMQQHLSKLSSRQARLDRFHPQSQIEQAKNHCARIFARSNELVNTHLTRSQHQFSLAANKLNLVSPLATMERGYSVLLNDKGKAIDSCEMVHPGDTVEARVQDGSINLEVLSNQKRC